jgi:hypothetical protein
VLLGSVCKTIGGNQNQLGKPCIFSFGSNTECRFDSYHTLVYCLTQVDSEGKAVQWGTCGPGCPIKLGDSERKKLQKKNNRIRLINGEKILSGCVITISLSKFKRSLNLKVGKCQIRPAVHRKFCLSVRTWLAISFKMSGPIWLKISGGTQNIWQKVFKKKKTKKPIFKICLRVFLRFSGFFLLSKFERKARI